MLRKLLCLLRVHKTASRRSKHGFDLYCLYCGAVTEHIPAEAAKQFGCLELMEEAQRIFDKQEERR